MGISTTGVAMFARLVVVGSIRVAVFGIFVASALWTAFRAVLNVAPNATANYLMNTTHFDDGEFWLLADAAPRIVVASAVDLGCVAAVYAYLALLVVVLPVRSATARVADVTHTVVAVPKPSIARASSSPARLISLGKPAIKVALTRVRSYTHHKLTAHARNISLAKALILEILELLFQTITLHDMLSNGVPTPLVRGYVALMVINCLYSFYQIAIAWKRHAFHAMVGDAILDAVFAVVFPAILLLQSITEFRGGLQTMALRQLFFPAQRYERRGRLYGKPMQINRLTTAFETLQITSTLDVVVTVGFNLLACLRWRRIVVSLRQQRQQHQQPTHTKQLVSSRNSAVHGISSREELRGPQVVVHVPVQRRVPAYVGVLFLVYGALTALFASVAISVSNQACETVPHCGSHAYQWFPGAATMACPCLVYVEGDLMDKIRAREDLPDASEELSLAAEAGSLRTIQLINRALQGELPAFVERCSDLRQLIIVYGDLTVLPGGWTGTFTKLTYLHVTGRTGQINLAEIPLDFFATTPSLRTLYLERHPYLLALPSFQGLRQLETLFIREAHSLTQLPSFHDTPNLKTLALIENDLINWLPDLTPVATSLQSVTIVATSVCCSGFLSHGQCNTSYPSCSSYSSELFGSSCYPSDADVAADPSLVIGSAQFPLISSSSLAVLQPFLDSGAACSKSQEQSIVVKPVLDSCDGVWYRQCGDGGICFTFTDLDVVCVYDPAVVKMRKTEILMGFACDPIEEQWLGCMY